MDAWELIAKVKHNERLSIQRTQNGDFLIIVNRRGAEYDRVISQLVLEERLKPSNTVAIAINDLFDEARDL